MVTSVTMTNPRILVVVGPTASGKSVFGVRVAQILDGEIISADSRQIYTDLTIGTAKPTEKERDSIPHHLIDHISLEKGFTAGQFGIEAGRIIKEIVTRKKIPVIVGGSGLYIQALIDGFFEVPFQLRMKFAGVCMSDCIKKGGRFCSMNSERLIPISRGQ